MRQIVVAVALALAVSGAAQVAVPTHARAAEPVLLAGVLTPDQIGLTEPAQGFYPYQTTTGLPGGASFSGFGGCGLFSIGFCASFRSAPYFGTFPGAAGTPSFNSFGGGSSFGLGSPFLGGFGAFPGWGFPGIGFSPICC